MVSRKGIYLHSCLIVFLNFCSCQNNETNESIQNYLNRSEKYTTNKITDILKYNYVSNEFQFDIEFNTIQYFPLSDTSTNVASISICGNHGILMGNKIYNAFLENGILKLNATCKQQLPIRQEINFVRVIEYNQFGILYVSVDGHCNIYMNNSTSSEWMFIQSIANTDKVTDGRLFVTENRLYLITINGQDSTSTYSKIYKWSGIHFDEIDDIKTKGLSKILSFPDRDSEIIIILQNCKKVKEHNMLVFRFYKDAIRKIQLILTNNTNHIVSYTYQGHHYLAVFEESKPGDLHRWNGHEFGQISKFSNYREIRRVFLTYFLNIPVIFLVQKDNLVAFVHSSNELVLLSSIPLKANFTEVLDATLLLNNTNTTLLLFMRTAEKKVFYMTVPFVIHTKEVDRKLQLNEVIECMINLEAVVQSYNTQSIHRAVNKTILHMEELVQHNDSVLSSSAQSNLNPINVTDFSTTTQDDVMDIKQRVDILFQRINLLRTILNSSYARNDVLYKKMIIKGELHVHQLNSKELRVKQVNAVEWNPDHWLSYYKDQTVTGRVLLKNVKVKNLTLPKTTKLMNNIFLRNNNQTLSSNFLINSLKAKNIYMQEVNGISFEDVYLRKRHNVIRGVKNFDSLDVNETQVVYLNKGNASETLVQLTNVQAKNYMFSKSVFVKNFNFQEINGVYWNNFKDSVFRIGTTNRITGNISISSIKCNKLKIKKISDIDASTLLTTTTKQNVTSVLHWTNILAQNISCAKINNVSLSSVALLNNNMINGPVSIQNLNIRKTLYINNPESTSELNVVEDHVIGTHPSDLLQIYNKRVKIIGNLQLSNVFVSTAAKVIINTEQFQEDVSSYYWSKSKFQTIPSFFEAQNGISTSHISAEVINNVLVSSYLTNNLDDKLTINWVFKNVTILGNVSVNRSLNHLPNLEELDLVSVKTTGRYKISNQKTIQGRVRIKNLSTKYLDDVKVEDVAIVETNSTVIGQKIFENLIIKENVVSYSILVNVLNNVDLKELKRTVLFVDEDEYIDTLRCTVASTGHVNISYMNQMDFNNYVQYLDKLYTTSVLENVKVNGKVQIANTQGLLAINRYPISEMFPKVVDWNQHIFKKNIKILGNVLANTVEVIFINKVNFSDMIQTILYRDWDQNITALWTFDQINSPNIFIPKINDINVENLINTKSTAIQNLLVWGEMHINYPIFTKSINSERMLCNIEYSVYNLQNPPTQYWNTVYVAHNVTLWDSTSDLDVIMKESVNLNKNNFIQSAVTFEHHLSANSIVLHKLLNGIYLGDLFNDAVVKDSEEQVVTGRKVFNKLSVSNAASEVVYFPIVNDIDIKVLNESIIYQSHVYDTTIKGPKLFFGGLQATKLISSTIADLHPQNLVSLNNPSNIPKAYFNSLTVENNLNMEFVNNLKTSEFFLERLLCRSPNVQFTVGTYYFDDAVILGNSNISAINDMSINDVVFDADDQIIPVAKYFLNNIVVNGNMIIRMVNGGELSNLYRNSILRGSDNTLNGYIKFHNISMFMNIEADNINGIAVSDIQKYIKSKAPTIQSEVIKDTIQKTDKVVSMSVNLSKEMSDQYLYLEKSNELQISVPNILQVYALNTKGNVMLYITQHELGSTCNLKNTCICASQKILQVTSENSINTISEANIQRVFSYEGEDMSTHLFTNGISTSQECRRNDLASFNESTSLMWITHSQKGAIDHYYYPDHLSGYISGVEYFTYNGDTFIVISRFYEPINNTHNVPCLIFKVSREKGDVRLIQSIDTDSAWVLHLFHTVQGITLIIGSVSTSEKLNDSFGATLYRFDKKTEQFKLIRKIPSSGCTFAVGVVLGPDSLIVLAHKDSAVQVFKYHPKYDNYYFYQNIFTNSEVTGIFIFYDGHMGISDPYLCIVTENGRFYLYSFKYIQRWGLLSSGELEGLQALVPFKLNRVHYLLAVTKRSSLLFNVVKHGSN